MSNFVIATNASGRTVAITRSVTGTSASYDLSGLGVITDVVRLANTGTAGLYFAIDVQAVTATANDVFLAAGQSIIIGLTNVQIGKAHIGYISPTGSPSLNIAMGTFSD
jgi:hypothetical protein